MTTTAPTPPAPTVRSVETARAGIERIISSGTARTYTARDRVDTARINLLCDVLGDDNPVHRDDEAARAAGHPGRVAPPAALQVWTMNLLGEEGGQSPVDEAYALAREAGVSSVVAVNSEQHYDRYVRPGELLTSVEVVESVSEVKQTGLGVGIFITTLLTFSTEEGERVGTMRFRTLWYAPGTTLEQLADATDQEV